jgi:hypothetical protein
MTQRGLLAATKTRFSGFWSPMPRSERDSEDSTGVLKSDFASLLRMTSHPERSERSGFFAPGEESDQ